MTLYSAHSSMSIFSRKKTQYQNFLNLSNVFLLITSTILIFSAIILIKFYYIDKLDFWSSVFWITPTLMIVLGVYTFCVCIYGFLISGSENRIFLGIYAILLSIAFLAQLGSIFTSLELRNHLVQGRLEQSSINEDLDKYNIDYSVTKKWDALQSGLHCCGGQNFLTGYNDYRNTAIGGNNSVPDSCCHEMEKNCGKGVFSRTETEVRNSIYVNGCLTVLKDKLDNEVTPMMIVYAVVGVVLAITEIITIVLACAYVAQLNRRRRRDMDFRYGNAGHDPQIAGISDPLNATSDRETIC
ncbi:CD63 antigen [Lepeophtheirus salmonis]|uniref:Tetraspanin n=1 Tax=Lepeophtheirus salmonis TaxID=72036 RepID=A0A0K2V4S9_LEPSM|nr:CD63 antigen-like [Lepeophtheirus salmonis]